MANTQDRANSQVNLISLKDAIGIIKKGTEGTWKAMQMDSSMKKPTFVLYSLPGIGKTEGLKSLAKSEDHIAVIDINAEFGGSLSMPIQDVSLNADGEKEAKVLHALHEDIADLKDHAEAYPDDIHYLFLDEFNRGDEFMKQTIMQLLLNNTLPGHKLPKNIFVVGAGNTSENIYGDEYGEVPNDVNPLDVAARDRIVPLFLKLSVDNWLEWAYQNKVHPMIIGFLEQKGGAEANSTLYRAPEKDDETGATPRSWTKLSHMFETFNPYDEESGRIIKALVQGHVGSSLADEFMKYASEVPNFKVDDLLSNKQKALSRFEALTATDKRQALLLMPSFIDKDLKKGSRLYLESFDEILNTKDQNAKDRFTRIFLSNDVLRKNFKTTFDAASAMPNFNKIRKQFSANS